MRPHHDKNRLGTARSLHLPALWPLSPQPSFAIGGATANAGQNPQPVVQLVSRRYQNKSTLITTNRAFGEWNEVFPNAACVVSLVDRLVHNAEIVAIEGESYRLKEARDRADARARKRRGAKS